MVKPGACWIETIKHCVNKVWTAYDRSECLVEFRQWKDICPLHWSTHHVINFLRSTLSTSRFNHHLDATLPRMFNGFHTRDEKLDLHENDIETTYVIVGFKSISSPCEVVLSSIKNSIWKKLNIESCSMHRDVHLRLRRHEQDRCWNQWMQSSRYVVLREQFQVDRYVCQIIALFMRNHYCLNIQLLSMRSFLRLCISQTKRSYVCPSRLNKKYVVRIVSDGQWTWC